jgi:hypothetical protein
MPAFRHTDFRTNAPRAARNLKPAPPPPPHFCTRTVNDVARRRQPQHGHDGSDRDLRPAESASSATDPAVMPPASSIRT